MFYFSTLFSGTALITGICMMKSRNTNKLIDTKKSFGKVFLYKANGCIKKTFSPRKIFLSLMIRHRKFSFKHI